MNKFKLKLQEVFAGYKVYDYFQLLKETQYNNEQKIKELRTINFLNLVHNVFKNVNFYIQYFKENNISESDFKSLEDLSKFPVMTKETYRKFFPDSVINIHAKKRDKVVNSTSGTTGTPFKFYLSRLSLGHQAARVLRYYDWSGRKNRELMVRFWSQQHLGLKKKVFHKFIENLFIIDAFDLSQNTFQSYYNKIVKRNPYVAEGYTSTIYSFALLLKKNNLFLNIPSTILSGETLYDFQAELIVERFKTEIFNRYGCREFGAIAQECSYHKGLHISEEDFIIEILDENNNPVSDGVQGNITITSLDNLTMPFVRYKIGDIGTLSKEKCECGRNLKLLKTLEGRVSDIIFSPTGKHISLYFFTILFRKLNEYISEFQINQNEKTKQLIIKIIPTEKYNKTIEIKIINEVKSLDNTLDILIELINEIPIEPNSKKKLLKLI